MHQSSSSLSRSFPEAFRRQVTEAALDSLLSKAECEPEWMHKYARQRHEHVFYYIGEQIAVLAQTYVECVAYCAGRPTQPRQITQRSNDSLFVDVYDLKIN